MPPSAGTHEGRRALSDDLQLAGPTRYATTTTTETAEAERSDTGPRKPRTGLCGRIAGSRAANAAEERDA